MFGFNCPTWQCQDLSRLIEGLPGISVLDSYGVAFMVLTEDGSRVHMSPSAAEVLVPPDRDHFWQHLRSVLEGVRSQASAGPARALPSWGPIALRHCVTRANSEVLRVVTFYPRRGASVGAAIRNVISLRGLPLTTRELEIARLIAAGESTKRVAAVLGISCHTARHHTERIFSKLGVKSRAAAAAIVTAAQ